MHEGHFENLAKIIKNLSRGEQDQLIKMLLFARPAMRRPLQSGVLKAAEEYLFQLANKPGGPVQAHARGRLWLIFMLLRYAGLRIKEIMQLDERDCQFGAKQIKCQNRIVPLPDTAARQMAAFWSSWPGRSASPFPFACDSSQIRRGLAACASHCGLEAGILNASAIRRQRALELEASGVPPSLVAWVLGARQDPSPFDIDTAQAIINRHIKMESGMKTSARNVFFGKIESLDEQGILVNVVLKTAEGLSITAIITKTSRDSLNLAPGSGAFALVKAPWVNVFPTDERAIAGVENCFQGKVKKIQRDSLACELQIELQQGMVICSLYANGATPSAEIKENSQVFVTFSPFSVILTAE